MIKICLFAVVSVAVIFSPPPLEAGFDGDLVPSYSGHYEDLEIVAAAGLVPAGPANTRPLTRAQIGAVLAEGLRENRDDLLDHPVGRRLVREFSVELEALGLQPPAGVHDPFLLIQPAEGRRGGRVEVVPYTWVRVDNVEPIYFNKLADRRLGVRASFSTAGGTLVIHDDLVVGNHSDEPRGVPDFGTFNALVEGEDVNSWVNRAYVRVNTGVVEAVFGKDWLRWGPGRTGTLGMGDASPALSHLLLRKRMNRVDFTTFVAALDFGGGEMLAGHRLQIAATSGLTLGVAEHARFRTFRQAPLYLLAFYPYSLVEKIVQQDESEGRHWRNNVMWSIDADWLATAGSRLYGSFLLDDWSFSRDQKPTQIGYQLGFMKAGVSGLGSLTLQAELTKIHRYTYTQARRSAGADSLDPSSEIDFDVGGSSLGHPIGPDSEGYFFAARYDASPSSRWELTAEVRRAGELGLGDAWRVGDPVPGTFDLSGVVETRTRIMLGYSYRPGWWVGSSVTVGGGLYKVNNAGHREDEEGSWDGIMKAYLDASW